MAPGEGCEELPGCLSFEAQAMRAGIRVGPGWGSDPAHRRRHVRGPVPDDDPVALRRFGHHQRQSWEMQRCEVEAWIQPEGEPPPGERHWRFGGSPIGPLGW